MTTFQRYFVCARNFGFLILATTCLCACVSATKIVRNDKATIKDYHDVYFINPKDDPRGINPKAIKQFESMGLKVRVVDKDKPLEGAHGTEFLISQKGHVMTCAHVIGEAKEATIWVAGRKLEADVLGTDKERDIAVLKLRDTEDLDFATVSFRSDKRYSLGEEVSTIGFPIDNLLGNSARFSKGSLSGTSGIKDNPNQIQVSAEVQPGNSGGPLFDKQGVVLGMINATMNPWRVAQETGALPQNLNFAVKGDVVLDYLKVNLNDVYTRVSFDNARSVDEVQKAVVKVRSGILSPELEGKPKLVARVDYKSHWDVWYRFDYFVVSVYDFDTHDLLFRAGQTHDNMVSDEDLVLTDTFAKVREALAKGPSVAKALH
ncbi:MAG: serine protease [Betaproteobacteria bacterium]